MWAIVLLFQIGVYSIVTKNCFNEIIKFKNNYVSIYIIAGLFFVLSLLLYFNLELVIKICTSLPFVISVISVHLFIVGILIVSMVVLKINNNNSKNFTFKNKNAPFKKKERCKNG